MINTKLILYRRNYKQRVNILLFVFVYSILFALFLYFLFIEILSFFLGNSILFILGFDDNILDRPTN